MPCPLASLFRAANSFRVTQSERVFFSQIRHRNALNEIAWEDAVQGLGMAMSTVASEKNRELFRGIVVYRQRVLQTVTSLRVVSLVFRGHDLLKITNINPQQEARFSLWKKLGFWIERRKWSSGLSQQLKGAWPNVRTGNKKAAISEFRTFLKINKSREQFLERLTLFYPIYG